jgi:hypothetical protein
MKSNYPTVEGSRLFQYELPWLIQPTENAHPLADCGGIYKQMVFIDQPFPYQR